MRRGRDRSAEVAKARADARERKASKAPRRVAETCPVNASNLRPTNSYGTPDFAQRGYYLSRSFTCKDCGRAQVWTATQQKWWYESAKGDVWTVAVRCRPCRRRERDRRSEARSITPRPTTT